MKQSKTKDGIYIIVGEYAWSWVYEEDGKRYGNTHTYKGESIEELTERAKKNKERNQKNIKKLKEKHGKNKRLKK